MRPNNRDILVKCEWLTEDQLEGLHRLLQSLETPDIFCSAHELVDRFKITSSRKKIIRESRHYYLRSFRFLLNKN
jgi:hypothetical protein